MFSASTPCPFLLSFAHILSLLAREEENPSYKILTCHETTFFHWFLCIAGGSPQCFVKNALNLGRPFSFGSMDQKHAWFKACSDTPKHERTPEPTFTTAIERFILISGYAGGCWGNYAISGRGFESQFASNLASIRIKKDLKTKGLEIHRKKAYIFNTQKSTSISIFHDGVVAHPPIDLVDPIGGPLGNERHEVTEPMLFPNLVKAKVSPNVPAGNIGSCSA